VVKVADFGLVRAVSSQTVTSSSSVLLGTVAYVSPEQVGRGIADARSDVYAAGLILFEMLTGTKAYSGDVPVNVAFMHVHEDVPKVSSRAAGTPKALDHAVSTASARDPDARPVDAAAFRALLGSVRSKLSPAQLDRRLGVQHPGSSGSGTTVALPVGSDTPDRSATTAQILTGPSSTARSDGGHGGDGRGGASSGALAPRASDAPRRRRRWPWVLVVLSALLLGLTVWTFTQGPLTPTPVPVVANKAFSEDVAAGVVISSEPGAGTTIWKSASVDLIVSKGPERYGVPTLEGVEITQALEALKNARLSSGTQSQQFSETVPEGTVISSDPAAGSPLPPGGAVNLVVSKGRQPIDLADWAGKPYEQAEAKLTADGLKATVSARENSDTVAKGAIIAQTPQTGPLFKGDTVQFVVSEGPVLVAVPDVFGKQAQDAEAALKAAGFNVKVEKLLGGVFGTVREQDPAAGTKVPKGSTITIRVV
jgi:serine/threonine-protein kinase